MSASDTPKAPIVGVGVIVALLEARNLCKLVYSHFLGCHSIWDVLARIFDMDDGQFIDVTLAIAMIAVIVWAGVSTLRNGKKRRKGARRGGFARGGKPSQPNRSAADNGQLALF